MQRQNSWLNLPMSGCKLKLQTQRNLCYLPQAKPLDLCIDFGKKTKPSYLKKLKFIQIDDVQQETSKIFSNFFCEELSYFKSQIQFF